MTFDAIGAFLMSFSAFLMLFCAFLTPFCAFLTQLCALLTPFSAFLTQFCAFLSRNLILEKIYRKKLSKADIGHFQIIRQIIDIDLILPQIIGDFKELSAKLSISKFEGKLSKNYRYRKI